MIVASCLLELQDTHSAGKVMHELKKRGITIEDFSSEKIIFLIERENIEDVRNELHALKLLKDVQNIHLTYYSMENVNVQSDPADTGRNNLNEG